LDRIARIYFKFGQQAEEKRCMATMAKEPPVIKRRNNGFWVAAYLGFCALLGTKGCLRAGKNAGLQKSFGRCRGTSKGWPLKKSVRKAWAAEHIIG
jgi:hypothetical protein